MAQASGSSSDTRPAGYDGIRASTSDRYAHGSRRCRRQVAVTEVSTAAVVPPRSLPQNNQFLRPTAMPRSARSAALLPIARSPSSTYRFRAAHRLAA